MKHDEFREYDAAYVLGALSPADRRAFEEHLAGCRECARAVREIAGVPGLLAAVPRQMAEAELGDPAPVPDTLLPALVREVRRRRTRRSWATGAVAAAAAVAVTLGGVGLAGGFEANPPAAAPTPSVVTGTPAAVTAMRQVGQHRLHATVAFSARAWGTSVDLTCAYDAGAAYPSDGRPTYVLVVRDHEGTTQQVATWRAVPGKEMTLGGASSWDRADISQVLVRTSSGRTVLELDA